MNSDAWQLLLGIGLALLGGPITGVWMYVANGEPIAPSGTLLALATVLPFVPLVAWLRHRRSFWLALSVFLWLSVGYYFSIGMWV